MLCVSFYAASSVEDRLLKYAVIAACYQNQWVFCRHKDRSSWEIPGGHREPGEEIIKTAQRELWEETGAVSFKLRPLAVYGVTRDGETTYGMLYYAEISELGALPEGTEIGEICFVDALPGNLTYPAIQPHLFTKALSEVCVEQASPEEAATVAALALKLWPDHSREEMEREFKEYLEREDTVAFLFRLQGKAVGFAQCGLRRDYVEGTQTSPVGYLEGIFVEEEHRHQGCAKALLQRCETWAKGKGCTEFASDCELGNETSLAFHLKLGFQEANRIICFTKKL